MKVLLALPPESHHLEVYSILGAYAPPLGLAWIASVLENEGHKVKIVDSPTLRLSIKDFIHVVKIWSPDIVGFSIITPTAYKAYTIAKILKKYFRDVPIICGGPHPTFMYEEALNGGFDVVIRGEGELTTLELVNAIERHGFPNYNKLKEVKGIAYKDGEGGIVVTTPRELLHDLSKLPWPAHHLLDMDAYSMFNKNIRVAHIIASRGCPYGCIFCCTSYFWGRKVRFRSPKDVVNEVKFLVDKYKIKRVAFMDDELTASKAFINTFVNYVKQYGLDLEFSCGSRVDHVDRELLSKMRDAGFRALYFGVESSSQATLNKIGKKTTINSVIKAFKLVKELGLYHVGTFVLGFPWETFEDMGRTIDFAIKLNPSYAQFTIATPYPGTPLYEYALKKNLIVDNNWEHYTTLRPVMRGFYFSDRDIARILARAYRKFYLRMEYLINVIKGRRLNEIATIVSKGIMNWFDDYVRSRIQPL
ncbi:MAG: radical SAM protein [Sulfolobales archaeon]|nr:B12-binding domain-containing radical SAM protein [Sulfolobales archaeon]MCX8186443.1 B12-binding domain-containing radical SAM protein [Sulfolobales archaeon]MDW7969773.1 radical SAM protein [Sulfolobales archaeon]